MRFVSPETVRLAVNGDWIEVKKELTVGEEKRYRTASLKRTLSTKTGGEVVDIDWGQMAFARVETYLVAWSATQPVTRAAIEALAVEDFEAIDDAIQAHVEATAQEKKALSGMPTLTTA